MTTRNIINIIDLIRFFVKRWMYSIETLNLYGNVICQMNTEIGFDMLNANEYERPLSLSLNIDGDL